MFRNYVFEIADIIIIIIIIIFFFFERGYYYYFVDRNFCTHALFFITPFLCVIFITVELVLTLQNKKTFIVVKL